jgi:hypothetical protein
LVGLGWAWLGLGGLGWVWLDFGFGWIWFVGLGLVGLGWAWLGLAGLGWAGLGWAGLDGAGALIFNVLLQLRIREFRGPAYSFHQWVSGCYFVGTIRTFTSVFEKKNTKSQVVLAIIQRFEIIFTLIFYILFY